jgi:hypothetical protein
MRKSLILGGLAAICSFATVETSTAQVNPAVPLSEKTSFVFSGFFQSSEKDCVEERSLTQAGSMTDPVFDFRFTNVQSIGQ